MIFLPQPKIFNIVTAGSLDAGIADFQVPSGCDVRIIHQVESLTNGDGKRNLAVSFDAALSRFDEYRINFSERAISIVAGTDAGAFRALTTLKRLCDEDDLPSEGDIHDWADVEMRIQHVDLKRIGWNFEYLLEILDLFAELKINFILLEYEDKFKFDFCDEIPVESAFTKEQIATLDERAHRNFIQVIPLVQCIGHFEYILRNDKYLEISESHQTRSQACPLHPGTFELFKNMAGEVMDAHPHSKFFHVGADEPFLLGTCPKCASAVLELGKGQLYGDFLNKVLSWVIDEKGKKPLFWADILQHYDDVAEMCRKDTIAVEWNYQTTSPRSDEIKFYQSPTGRVDRGIFENELTEELHSKFDKYLEHDPEKGDFKSLPFGTYLLDLGFEVVSAGNVNSVDNVLTHSTMVKQDGMLGNLATYWAAADTNRPPYTIFETCMQGVCMLAASTWNLDFEREQRGCFFRRIAKYFRGDEKTAALYEILDACNHLIVPGDNNRKDEAFFGEVKRALDNISPSEGRHLTFLLDFLEKIKLEKELDVFRKEKLATPLLADAFYGKLDLLPYCNERFANTEESPGWSRIPQNDLRFIPKGDVCFNGVPFWLNPDLPDGGGSVIMIGDYATTPFLPRFIKGMKVKTKAYALNFLHGHIEGKPLIDGLYGRYVLHYADGEREEIPLLYNKNMGEWWHIVEIEDASIGWSGENLKKANVGLHLHTYFPKHQEKEISSIDFICESKTVLALAAITAITHIPTASEGNSGLLQKITLLQSEFSNLETRMETDLRHFLSDDGVNEFLRIAFLSVRGYFSKLRKVFNREGVDSE